jgi:hypothetical protein
VRREGDVTQANDPSAQTAISLAGLGDVARDQVMARWQVLRPHLEDGVPARTA